MQLPPTPPVDEQNQKPGYSTPPNAIDVLTPQQTPRGMLKATSDVVNHQSTTGRTNATRSQEQEDATMLAINGYSSAMREVDDDKPRPSSQQQQFLDMDKHVAYIPSEETAQTTHMQGGNDSPHFSAAALTTSPDVSHLRIRKKRKQITSRQRTASQSSNTQESGDWNDIPADMLVNDTLYKQIRRKNMDRIEAMEDGTAIEAVVVTPDTKKPSLRHVKKRHSLRIGSGSTITAMSAGRKTPVREIEAVEGASPSSRRTASLRHKKAFEPSRSNPEHTLASSKSALSTPTISKKTLRHERRPLSATGRPQTSGSLQTAPLSDPPVEQPRHVSLPLRLKEATQESPVLRRLSKEHKIEVLAMPGAFEPSDISQYHSFSSQPGLSPSIKSHRFANTQTPMSALSDRTEMELCEAKNVTLFPHSNDSVLLISNGNVTDKKPHFVTSQLVVPPTLRPLSFTFENPEPSTSTSSDVSFSRTLSTPEIQINGNVHAVDSPLTNPRAAPLPPAIKFIPPTPSIEGDKQLALQEDTAVTPPALQRSGSLMRTARRLSGTLLTPFMFRGPATQKYQNRPHTATGQGNDRLHPMWQPNSMWDDDDYSEDEYEDEHDERLPAGGDTSEHPAQRGLFPRQMSVRMPGFRGTGGFLLGNSLGVERHGTNKRRHHVELPSQKQKEAPPTLLQSIKNHISTRRAAREEAAREKRRAEIKDSIGLRVVHNV